MKIFFDTEFIEDGKTIDLLSIGMVREDGMSIYLENAIADVSKASPWVCENVLPHLRKTPGVVLHPVDIAHIVKNFVGDKPEFWAYYGAYDWVSLCQLYGKMIDLPPTWPMFCMDIKQFAMGLGNPRLPEQLTPKHHALNDADWTKDAYEFLVGKEIERDNTLARGE